MIKNILFVLLCFAVTPNYVSQTIINGHIGDKETGEDLIGASVKIIGSKYGCVSDINGNFQIKTKLIILNYKKLKMFNNNNIEDETQE